MHHNQKYKKKSSQQGFSLLELMIVVAIIGILAISANFSYSPANSRLKSAARDLYSNMQTAKMEAVKRSEDWGIIFNTTTNSYAICEYNTGACAGDNTTIDLDNYGSDIQFGYGSANTDVDGNPPPEADGISYSGNALYFDFKGMSGNTGYVYIENNKDTSFAVGTKSLAGVVKIRKWAGTDWE